MRVTPGSVPCLLLLVAAGGCASAPSVTGSPRTFASSPDVTVRETWSHYPVEGGEAHEMGVSMAENAPRQHGVPAFGLTRWSLSWRFDVRRFAGTCRIVSPHVTSELEIVLPRWSAGAPTRTPLVLRWELFLDALTEHELGHRRLVLEAGREIAERLRRTSAPTCAMARQQADRAARQVVEDYDHRNRLYDQATGGGRGQGVRWP